MVPASAILALAGLVAVLLAGLLARRWRQRAAEGQETQCTAKLLHEALPHQTAAATATLAATTAAPDPSSTAAPAAAAPSPATAVVAAAPASPPAEPAEGSLRRRSSQQQQRRSGALLNVNSEPVVQVEETDRFIIYRTTTLPVIAGKACSRCGVVAAKRNCSYQLCKTCCRRRSDNTCPAHTTIKETITRAVAREEILFDLSYSRLTRCSPEIGSLRATLVSLNLSNNQLESLPDEIGLLTLLQELFLQYNHLRYLPESICQLQELFELDIKYNVLERLPRDFGLLSKLNILDLTNNHIRELPASFGGLKSLTNLSVFANRLESLPQSFSNCTNMEILYLGFNPLRKLPEDFGRLERLREMDVSACRLQTLPKSFCQLRSLSKVCLADNGLLSLPDGFCQLKELHDLYLERNQLTLLPGGLAQLKIYNFNAHYNPLYRSLDELQANNLYRPVICGKLTLKELCAREIAKRHLPTEQLPHAGRACVASPQICTVCLGPFFRFHVEFVVFETIGVYNRVPLAHKLCSVAHLKTFPEYVKQARYFAEDERESPEPFA
eukprot:m.212390 g.212390  ORF g.212390 m.212390 type:complete len:555 (-) comp20243_c0_seq1:309-1973(-)